MGTNKELEKVLENRFISDVSLLRMNYDTDELISKIKNYDDKYRIDLDQYNQQVEFLEDRNKIFILLDSEYIVYEYYKNMNTFIYEGKGLDLVDICNDNNIEIYQFIK